MNRIALHLSVLFLVCGCSTASDEKDSPAALPKGSSAAPAGTSSKEGKNTVPAAAAGSQIGSPAVIYSELVAALEKSVPSTAWSVEISAAQPAIVIAHKEALLIERLAEASLQVIRRESCPLAVQLFAVPYLDPAEYVERAKRNQQGREQRREFAEQQLGEMEIYPRWQGKNTPPLPPGAFHAQTDAERATLLDYAFLWLHTESVVLPSHNYKTVAFQRQNSVGGFFSITDEAKQEEYHQLLSSLEEVLTPYGGGGISASDR
jgi:hypothetical protein